MVCASVRSIIPSLKLGDYLSVQAHKPCSISSHAPLPKSVVVNTNYGNFMCQSKISALKSCLFVAAKMQIRFSSGVFLYWYSVFKILIPAVYRYANAETVENRRCGNIKHLLASLRRLNYVSKVDASPPIMINVGYRYTNVHMRSDPNWATA